MQKRLQSTVENSTVVGNEIINVTNTVPTISDDNSARYKMNCYILHIVLSVTILLFIIVTS